MRVLVGRVDETFHDIASLRAAERAAVLDPDSYAASRALGSWLRAAGSTAVVLVAGWGAFVAGQPPTADEPP